MESAGAPPCWNLVVWPSGITTIIGFGLAGCDQVVEDEAGPPYRGPRVVAVDGPVQQIEDW